VITYCTVASTPFLNSIMKISNLSVLALTASVINARFIEKHETDQVVLNANVAGNEQFLIETAPGKTQWVTEEEKWELRRVRAMFELLSPC
jgi:leucyl aminopeptidase